MNRIITLLFLIASFSFLYGEESTDLPLPAILIAEVRNLTGQDQYNAIAGTVTDTLVQTLRLSGNFRVTSLNNLKSRTMTREDLTAYSRNEFFDNLIYGEMDLTEPGEIRFTLTLYNPVEGEQTTRVERTAPGILSVFDTSDELILALLNSFSDRHWGFGSLILENSGLESVYSLYLNGIPLGESIKRLDRVLIGEYELEIRQLRFGSQETIFSRNITITEGETQNLEFAIPDLLPHEKKDLNETYDRIVSLYKSESQREEIPYELRILSYLETFPFLTDNLTGEIRRFREIKDHWLLKNEWWRMEEESPEVDPEYIRESLRIYLESDHEGMRQEALLNGRFYCALRRMQAITAFEEKELEKGRQIYEELIETAFAFDSPTGFGYDREFPEIRHIFEQDWSERKIRRKLLKLLKESLKISEDFLEETRNHKLLILTDYERKKARVNLSRQRLPYLDEDYRKSTVTVDDVTKETTGEVTAYFLADWDLDARILEGLSSRQIEPFQLTLGLGGGSWTSLGVLWRFYRGRVGLRSSVEFRISSESGSTEGVFSFPLESDYFYRIGEKTDLYGGVFADLTDSLEGGLIPRYGLNLGAAYLGKRQTWYLDNRIFLGPEIRYAPQLGIRY